MSSYLESTLLNHIFRGTAFSQPSTIAIALCTSAPEADDTGDLTGKEVTGGGYARHVVGPGDSAWDAVVSGTTKNTAAIEFSAATGDWSDPVTHVAIVDSSTIGQGNLLFFGELTAPKTVSNSDIFRFSAGQLLLQLS